MNHSNLQKALLGSLIMLSHGEDQLRLNALKFLLDEFKNEDISFDKESFAANERSPLNWFAQASTLPFLAKRRIVIVRHLLRIDSPEESLMENAKRLGPTSLIILVVDPEPGNDIKQRRFEVSCKKWESWVKACKGSVINFVSNPKQTSQALKDAAQFLGKKLTPAANAKLMELTNGNLSAALNELDKLALFTLHNEEIRTLDIEQLVTPSRDWNVFKMVDAALANNPSEAIKQLRILLEADSKPDEAAYVKIMPAISRQLKLLWQARICIQFNVLPQNISKEMQETFPQKPNITKEAEWSQNKLIQRAKSMDYPFLQKCFELIAETDAKLKGILPSYSTYETLEQMLLNMCLIKK